MIVGTGADLVEIQRITAVLERHGDRLPLRILHAAEVSAWRGARDPGRFLAKRFAAKEAAAKALGTGMRTGVAFNQISVEHGELGAPCIRLFGRAREIAEELGVRRIHLTITDERNHALAFVVLEA